MKRMIPGALCAIALAGFSGNASAVPIYFDFTGTMTGNSATSTGPGGTIPATEGYSLGGAISGGFTFETDRLFDSGLFGTQHSWVDWQPVNLAEPLAAVNFGGRDVAIPLYSGLNYADISFGGGCTPDGCPPNLAEGFNLFASSMDAPFIDSSIDGTYHTTSMMLISSGDIRLPDYPFFQTFDYFDETTVDPYSIVSLPLYDTLGLFIEQTTTCTSGNCTYDSQQFSFSLDTVTRGIGARAVGVPEPGTLALFAAGLLGLGLRWRKRERPLPREQQA